MSARYTMTPAEFRHALSALDMSPAEFARLIGANERNTRRAAEDGSDGPGPAAAFALRCLLVISHIADMSEAELLEVSGDLCERALRGEFDPIKGGR